MRRSHIGARGLSPRGWFLMNEAYIVSTARAPIGKLGGWLKDCSPVDLGAHAMKAALARAGLPSEAGARSADPETSRPRCGYSGDGRRLCAGHGLLVRDDGSDERGHADQGRRGRAGAGRRYRVHVSGGRSTSSRTMGPLPPAACFFTSYWEAPTRSSTFGAEPLLWGIPSVVAGRGSSSRC